MKKLAFVIIGFFFSSISFSQTQPAHKETILKGAQLKSGNSQDILTSFYQLAIQNLIGDEKVFQFSGSLFAIKSKTNPEIWNSLNYTKHTFSRNFVLTANLALDSSYRPSSSALGFRYALINKRDKTIFDFSLEREKDWNTIVDKSLSKYLKSKKNNVSDPDFKKASDFFNDADFGLQTALTDLPSDFRDTLAAVISKNSFFKNSSLSQFRNHLQNSYDSLSKIIENKPLMVIGGNFASGTDGKLFKALNFNAEYMKGLVKQNSKMNLEFHLRAMLSFNDDSLSMGRDLQRGVFSSFAGFNWIILKNANRKSILEFRGGVSQNHILSGIHQNEKLRNYSGEGTIRLRLNNNLWIPFDIRYHPSKAEVLGFLSIKSNFDWLDATRNKLN